MSRFTFRFEALLEYRRHKRELCRQLLADVLGDVREVDREIDRLEAAQGRQQDELRSLSAGGPFDVDRAAARRYHVAQLQAQRSLLRRREQTIDSQLAVCRQALARADGEVRALERLKESACMEHRRQSERRAGIELEDAWQAGRLVERSRS